MQVFMLFVWNPYGGAHKHTLFGTREAAEQARWWLQQYEPAPMREDEWVIEPYTIH